MIDPELPVYATETRFYREFLAISWEYGVELRQAGVLVPDAQLDAGQALFQLTLEKLQKAQREVFLHKARQTLAGSTTPA